MDGREKTGDQRHPSFWKLRTGRLVATVSIFGALVNISRQQAGNFTYMTVFIDESSWFKP